MARNMPEAFKRGVTAKINVLMPCEGRAAHAQSGNEFARTVFSESVKSIGDVPKEICAHAHELGAVIGQLHHLPRFRPNACADRGGKPLAKTYESLWPDIVLGVLHTLGLCRHGDAARSLHEEVVHPMVSRELRILFAPFLRGGRVVVCETSENGRHHVPFARGAGVLDVFIAIDVDARLDEEAGVVRYAQVALQGGAQSPTIAVLAVFSDKGIACAADGIHPDASVLARSAEEVVEVEHIFGTSANAAQEFSSLGIALIHRGVCREAQGVVGVEPFSDAQLRVHADVLLEHS